MKRTVRKEQIWKEPKYKALVTEGLDGDLLFYVKEIYNATFTKSINCKKKDYISFVKYVKKITENLTRTDMINKVAVKKLLNRFGVKTIEDCGHINHKYNKFITKKFYKAVTRTVYEIQMKSDKIEGREIFGVKAQAQRRVQMVKVHFNQNGKIIIPITWNENKNWEPINKQQISEGDWIVFDRARPLIPVEIYSNKKDATVAYKTLITKLARKLESSNKLNQAMMLDEQLTTNDKTLDELKKDFKLRKISFDSKMSEESKLTIINNLYDALDDMAKVLKTRKSRILFNGKLGFYFNKGIPEDACAICIPDKKVMALSTLYGAGNIAHEWMHYLDSTLGDKFRPNEGKYLSDVEDAPLKEMRELVQAMKYKANGKKTRFYRESLRDDKEDYIKLKESEYWSLTTEMLARTFAMFVRDNLEYDSPFLIRNRESNIIEPRYTKEEKKVVYKKIEKLIHKVKKLGII